MMKQEIKHRRLYAFYNSKVLNSLLLVEIVCLLLLAYVESMLLPVICGSIAMLFFIGYALWIWIKKPKSIVINTRISNVADVYTLYGLIIGALYPVNQWLLLIPIALSVIVLFLALTNNHDEPFTV